MAFLETPVFPEELSYGSSGGPSYSTTVISMSSGHEQRNANWAQARHEYDAAYAIQDDITIQLLIAFFHIAQGMANSFRFKDHLDHDNRNSYYGDNWMYMGQTDGASAGPYQIKKYYHAGTITSASERIRDIKKPRNTGNWSVGQGGSNVAGGTPSTSAYTEGVDFSIDYTNGELTWTSVPPVTSMWWKGQFDVPCRFNIDHLQNNIEAYQANTAQVPIVEIRI